MNTQQVSRSPWSASYIACAIACSLLGACASVPSNPKAPFPAPAVIAQEVKRPAPPKQELTSQTLYSLLLAEIALQRGEPALSTRAYQDLLKNTQDYRIAERAAQVALSAQDVTDGLSAAQRWLELEPNSILAQQTLAGILVSQGKLELAKPHLKTILAAEGANVGRGFLFLNQLLGRHPNKAEVLALVQELGRDYPKLPEAHFAEARAAWNADNKPLALQAIDAALALQPSWEDAALFKAQVLQNTAGDKALEFYKAYLRDNPRSRDLRLAFARYLVQEKQYPAAREEFKRLSEDFPEQADVPLAIGLLSMQLQDFDAAETYLRLALDRGIKDDDLVRLYLGQINEERKRWDEARKWYDSVDGAQAFNAKLRVAGLLARQGKLPEARGYLQGIPVETNQQRTQVVSAEAALLRDAKQYQEAFDVLAKALEKLPNHPDLLYDYAMAAEKINRIDILEASLKKLIQVKPDNAHAYNALGYTLADRTNRFDEAKQYLDKAIKLAPNDAFILDSLGWLQYRMKDNSLAISTLRHALSVRPDPEIAAHLGEVLWVNGDQQEAKKVWNSALKDNPNHEAVLSAMQKYKARD
jgi:tetratricopeptide (TPR) repeat protein